MENRRIFISYSDTGGGHKAAAEAIKQAIDELAAKESGFADVKVFAETSVENTNVVNSFFVWLYNYLLRTKQDWMKYYIAFIELCKPNDSKLGYILSCKALQESLLRIRPAILVSVHPMVNHYMVRSLEDIGMRQSTKFVIVVTDPNANLWSGWACPGADLTIVPNDLAQGTLVKMGIDPKRILTLGMPIDPRFVSPPVLTRQKVLTRLGLYDDKLTVLLSGGSVGGGAIAEIYQALKAVKRPIQVVVLCGRNMKLMAKLKEESVNSPVPTVALAYSESLADMMAAADILVTKAGGLTTFEAIARRLPMALDVLTEPMPQEMGTVDMLVEAGLASPLKTASDIVSIVENLQCAERGVLPLPKEHNLDRVDAVYDIARTILGRL